MSHEYGAETCLVSYYKRADGKDIYVEIKTTQNDFDKLPIDDPVQTLRGFEKVYLNAGQKKTVTITLGEDAFTTYKVYRKAFTLNYGKYTVKVGSSSRQLPLSAEVEFKRPVKYVTVNE